MADRDVAPPTSPRTRTRVRIRWLERIETIVASLLLLAILVLVMTQVVQRVFGLGSSVWTGELARYSLVWLTFASVGLLLAQENHISLHLTDLVMPKRVTAVVKVFANVVVAAISAMMTIEAYALVTEQSGQVSPAAGIPLTWIYSVPLVGFSLTILRALLALWPGRGGQ